MKRVFAFFAVCIMAVMMQSFVHAEGLLEFKVDDTGYDLIYTGGSSSNFVASKNGKFGVITSNGAVLVPFEYDCGNDPNKDGYIVLYKSNSRNFNGDMYLHLNSMSPESIYERYSESGKYYTSFDFDSEGDYDEWFKSYVEIYYDKWLKSDDSKFENLGVSSYVFSPDGTCIYSNNDAYVNSCGNNIIEVRSNYRVGKDNQGECGFYYDVEYIAIKPEIKTIYSAECVSESTAFSANKALILKETSDGGFIQIIDDKGNNISKITQFKLENNWNSVNGMLICGTLYNDSFIFFYNTYFGPFSCDIYSKQCVELKLDYIYAFNEDYEQAIRVDGMAVHNDWSQSVPFVYLSDSNENKISGNYKSIEVNAGEKHYLAQRLDDTWTYLDKNCKEHGSYQDAGSFNNGRALVVENGKAYIIDESFNRISEYFDGAETVMACAIVKNDGKRYLVTDFFDSVPIVSVKLNNETLRFEQKPVIQDGRTLVPLRAIFEALGATVQWDDATKTVTAIKGNTTIKLTIGSKTLYKNGAPVVLDVPAQIFGAGYTMVPIRAIAESFDATVEWDGKTRTVFVTSKDNIYINNLDGDTYSGNTSLYYSDGAQYKKELVVAENPKNKSEKVFCLKAPLLNKETWTYFWSDAKFVSDCTYLAEFDIYLDSLSSGSVPSKGHFGICFEYGDANEDNGKVKQRGGTLDGKNSYTVIEFGKWYHVKYVYTTSKNVKTNDKMRFGIYAGPAKDETLGRNIATNFYLDNINVKPYTGNLNDGIASVSEK